MDGTDVSEQTNTMTDGEVATGVAAEAAPTPSDQIAAVAVADNGELDAASLMEQFLSDPSHDYKSLKYGDVMDGIIMHVDRDELLVDIGSKSEGVIPSKEYSSLTSEEKDALAIGDHILVFVVQPENQEGHAVVSIDRARQEKSWRRLQEIYEANEVIEAEVTNYNKGGLLVNLDGVRGFVPASQVTEIRGGDEASKQADMARLIGTSLALKVIEINRHRNRLILSERQAVQERRDVMKEKLIEELREGEVRTGRVSSICDFGAFVDIGGADGLVHLSELSWSRVRHPSEVLKVGQEVEVQVLGINATEKKIALSIKRTQAEPWSRVAAKYEVGQLVRGAVTQLANFGAFARIEDGIEGLIHVSELVDDRVTHPKQVVTEGQDLLLRIIRIDPQRRRMGLSLRRALDTLETDLISAFGDDALTERDALIETIRERLEGEGIELGQALQTGGLAAVPEPEEERPRREDPVAMAAEGLVEAAAPRQREWVEPKAPPAPRRERERPERPKPAAPELAGEAGGEMSAMELAFALAGAALDEEAAATEAASAAPAATASAAKSSDAEASATADAAAETPVADATAAEDVTTAAPVAEASGSEEIAAEAPVAEATETTSDDTSDDDGAAAPADAKDDGGAAS
jgi:small subunit ribosomal protein S1